MSIVNTVISFEQLVRDFDSLFRHRVFRLETLDWYDAENERGPYQRFLAGEAADWAWREPWKRLVRDVRTSGRIMERVHIVSEPVSDYIRFQLLHVYPANVEAGEHVAIAGRGAIIEDEPPGKDFWLFDDELAARLVYSREGAVSQVVMERDPSVLRWYRVSRDMALRRAIPLARYVAEHNITERMHAA
jgi:hypothetical protein